MSESLAPIGVFDSGVGGLTVVRAINERLPNEPIVYLGDTARVPYGTKSADTVIRYAFACARILVERGIKVLVVACNTASAFALEALRDSLDIPVIGVVEPGARAALTQSTNKHIGIIGTEGTIQSAEYQNTLKGIDPSVHVYTRACPLFVPLADEGWLKGPVPENVATTYLSDLRQSDIDTLILGCTHYPLLKSVIAKTMGPSVALVDSAEATAHVVSDTLEGINISAPNSGAPRHHYLVSDDPTSFAATGRLFLNKSIEHVEWVDF